MIRKLRLFFQRRKEIKRCEKRMEYYGSWQKFYMNNKKYEISSWYFAQYEKELAKKYNLETKT